MTETTPLDLSQIKPFYTTGQDSLADAFFSPCLSHCISYRRAAGYFSSSALKTWSGALARILEEKVSIQLMISPELSQEDAQVLRATTDEASRALVLEQLSERMIEEALLLAEDPDVVKRRLELLAWMIVAGQLEIRFAIPKHVDDAGIFHDKSGVFRIASGERIAFVGSANESISGHVRNHEKLHVFRSWLPEELSRIDSIEEDFDASWRGDHDHLLVTPLSKKSIELIRVRAPLKRPSVDDPPAEEAKVDRWRHQAEAVDEFLKARHGVLEMATGTGKTNTAIKILDRLLAERRITSILVVTEGTDLLDQWSATLAKWNSERGHNLRLLRHYERHHQGQSFANSPTESALVISTGQLAVTLRQMEEVDLRSCVIIHDEVHGFGAPSFIRDLKGLQASIPYRLGLSATPEREYDETGSKFIEDEIGPVVFRFGLKEAIERGILCEFDYVPLPFELTAGDKARLSAVYSKRAVREREGNPMSKEEFWTELANVYKTAEQKPQIFAEYLDAHNDVIKGTIIFVENIEFGDRVLPILDRYTHLYRTYYAGVDRENLVKFGRGEIDCLLTCHRISQGIDIRDLRTVILFSAARARLETIQRIGRCLRSDPRNPSKRALVIDFVRSSVEGAEENADEIRSNWLTELSRIRRKE